MALGDTNVPSPDDRQVIVCLHCNKPQEVGRKAQSLTCKFCHKSLKLLDERFSKYEARRTIETLGIVTVEKKGNVVTDRVNCGGLIGCWVEWEERNDNGRPGADALEPIHTRALERVHSTVRQNVQELMRGRPTFRELAANVVQRNREMLKPGA